MASSPLSDLAARLSRSRTNFVLREPVWALLAWLLCCGILLWLSRGQLLSLGFRDPDDAMRLQQVRDWIGGQPFLDVSQHRVNPPLGGPMHWSRIVDMPIAALILLLRPLLGTALAETIACAAVPLLLLGCLTGALFVATRRIAGDLIALLACALLLTTPTILVQFGALRIDHHGWQILMATIAFAGAVDARPARGGAVAGLALALWLQISSEGLPYAALFAALFALRQWIAADQGRRFQAYAIVLGSMAVGLALLLRGPASLIQQQCDSLSAAYAWPLLGFAIATPLAARLIGTGSAKARFAVASIGAAAALAIFAMTGRPCLTGDPFAALGETAYRLWYLQVMEGRPIWEQARSMMGLILLPPLVGLVATILAARAAPQGEARARWIVVALLLMGATAVAVMVMRAMSVAHVLALPGTAWLTLRLFQRAQQQRSASLRVIGSSAVALLTPAALCALWIAVTTPGEKSSNSASTPSVDCRGTATIASLRHLPPSTLFAPLDMGPDILIRTRHSVIGTAHHRNAAGITAVVEGFTAPPGKAHAIIARLNGGKGPDYLIACPGLNEFDHYAKEHRASLAAALDRGAVPSWLQRVPIRGNTPLRVYRIMRPRN